MQPISEVSLFISTETSTVIRLNKEEADSTKTRQLKIIDVEFKQNEKKKQVPSCFPYCLQRSQVNIFPLKHLYLYFENSEKESTIIKNETKNLFGQSQEKVKHQFLLPPNVTLQHPWNMIHVANPYFGIKAWFGLCKEIENILISTIK